VNEPNPNHYVVVARRYRPQAFGELIGQDQVTQALENAISTNRVGHAYLFTGARGVGKTSAARILAKTLNCTSGTPTVPCQECDICQSIAAGSDMDVIEIDGASNRGIDEIRQLRSSVGVRPSRARFKIYIIDEVHMLTKEAFNALLKTLEEPPEHVKFVFCTTDPERIPITVLSRCQRFDFPPIGTSAIVDRLDEIVRAEGATADREALELLARKAAGSMRDSQSLLEQLLSFAGDHISVDAIHSMLGTASLSAIADIVDALADRNAAAALELLDQAIGVGIDVGQLAEQILGYVRDVLAVGVGCKMEQLQVAPASDHAKLVKLADRWGTSTVLNVMQIMDQAIVRMRQVLHRRTLVEIALVKITELENLAKIVELINDLNHRGVPANQPATQKKTKQPALGASPTVGADATSPTVMPDVGAQGSHLPTANVADRVAADTNPTKQSLKQRPKQPLNPAVPVKRAKPLVSITAETATSLWLKALDELGGLDADIGRQYVQVAVDGKQLTVRFDGPLNVDRFQQEAQASSLRRILRDLTGDEVELRFEQHEEPDAPEPINRKKAEWVLRQESLRHPLVQQAIELFDGDVTRVQAAPRSAAATATASE
jgi:DNA polymerase-3 subunit gamma/tau